MEQPQLDVDLEIVAFPNFEQSSKGGRTVDISGDIKLNVVVGRNDVSTSSIFCAMH